MTAILVMLSCHERTIYIPEDWEKVVTGARRTNPFKVRRMKQEDFFSLKVLKEAIVNRKVNTIGGKVEWLKIQWISVSKDKPLQFCYRYSHNTLEVWKTVDLKRKSKGRPPDLTLPPAYTGARAINKKKMDNLMELLEFVPPVYHSFYTSLNGTADDSNSGNDPDSDAE